MSRGRTVASLAGCGLAGLLVALAVAGSPDAGAETVTTTPTATTLPPTVTATVTAPPPVTTTAPPPVTTTAPPTVTTTPPRTKPVPPPRQPDVIAAGVTIGRVLVGGLSPAEANALMRERFAKPLPLVLGNLRRMKISPRELGASAYVGKAVKRARRARAGSPVALQVKLTPAKLDRWLRALAEKVRRDPVDSRLILRGVQPFATKARSGRRLEVDLAQRAITESLETHERAPVTLSFKELKPKVTADTIGSAIVIRRGSNRLFFYNSLRLKRTFHVATGESRYPTPLGRFEVAVMWRDPWWYPPPSDWAKDSKPIPPGPGNPLGTRWMGLTAPYVGIHGTPDAASIGYSVSHGCIRMLIPEVEWLFEQIDVGTPVFVVAA